MTYRELLFSLPLKSFEAVDGPSAKWLDQEATVRRLDFAGDDFCPVDRVGVWEDGDGDIFDIGHIYLEID